MSKDEGFLLVRPIYTAVQPGSISFRTSYKCLFNCPGKSLKKVNTILFVIFKLTYCGANSVDPDQLASSGSTLFSMELIYGSI